MKIKDTEKKVLSYCRKYTMFQPGDKVLLGVSGGADSICLLFVLLKLQQLLEITLYVVHVNHGIREDAAEDAEYVRRLCEQLDIPFLLKEVNVLALADELGLTSEEAGREARYRIFEKACESFGCNKIAVAHNSNDRAETMLFHLFRGTGLKGIAGIQPVRGQVVRPLLCLEREEIERYLQQRKIDYRQDSTNDTDDYTRNRIRHHILPYAKQNIADASIMNMCRAGDIFAEEEEYLRQQTAEAAEKCVIGSCLWEEDATEKSAEGSIYELSAERFLQQHPVIQKRLLLKLLKQLSPAHQDITAGHIEDILTLFQVQRNRQIHLPYGIRGRRSYSKILLERIPSGNESGRDGEEGFHTQEIPLMQLDNGNEQMVSLENGSKFIFRVSAVRENITEKPLFSENRYTKWLDYDKMVKPIQIRTRKTGDYLSIKGNTLMQHKKLKDYMISEKIPAENRNQIPLIAEESHVIWLVGFRISEHYKVTENTKRVLQIQYIQDSKETL